MNQTTPTPPRPAQMASPYAQHTQQGDWILQVQHYAHLLWRWKWFILSVLPVVGTGAFLAALKFISMTPEMPSTVLIGLERPAVVGSIEEYTQMGTSKVELLRTNRFLRQIVDEMGLRLVISKEMRESVVDSCVIEEEAINGRYSFNIDGETYQIVLRVDRRTPERVVASGSMAGLTGLRLQGIRVRFAHEFRRAPRPFVFHVISSQYAAEDLSKRMRLTAPDPRRGIDHIAVSLVGKDYNHTTRIINAIADAYVRQSLSFRKRRLRETIELLERQLATAGGQSQGSEDRLRSFLSTNPGVGLGVGAQQTLGIVMERERRVVELNEAISEARRLQSQFTAAASREEKAQITNEILYFLMGKGNTKAAVLIATFQQLSTARAELERTTAKEHPSFAENQRRLETVSQEIAQELTQYIGRTQQSINALDSESRSMMARLNTLPGKERELALLQGRQQVDQDLHAEIMRRYNEAKVADAAEVADVFVMDYATPPLPDPPLMMLLKLLGMAFAAGCAAAFGPPVLFDIIDKKARTQYKFSKLSPFPLLEMIPELPARLSPGGDTSQLPITARGLTHYVDEQFRSLRTKALMRMSEAPDRSIAVTSLSMDEGKSTIAINLAVTMAQQGLKTLLIDADLRRGRVAESLGVKRTPGLSTILSETIRIQAGTVPAVVQSTTIPRLYCLSAGEEVANPQELLGSPIFAKLKEAFCQSFDMVIVDTPPFGAVSDGLAIHELVSRYILVARAGVTNIDKLQKILSEYPPVMKKVMGVVLNRADKQDINRRKAYSRYYRRDTSKAESSPPAGKDLKVVVKDAD